MLKCYDSFEHATPVRAEKLLVEMFAGETNPVFACDACAHHLVTSSMLRFFGYRYRIVPENELPMAFTL